MQGDGVSDKIYNKYNIRKLLWILIPICTILYIYYGPIHHPSSNHNHHQSRSLLSSSPLLSNQWALIDTADLGSFVELVNIDADSHNSSTEHSPIVKSSPVNKQLKANNISEQLRTALEQYTDVFSTPSTQRSIAKRGSGDDTDTSESFFQTDHAFVSSIYDVPPNTPVSSQQNSGIYKLSRLIEAATKSDVLPLISKVHMEEQAQVSAMEASHTKNFTQLEASHVVPGTNTEPTSSSLNQETVNTRYHDIESTHLRSDIRQRHRTPIDVKQLVELELADVPVDSKPIPPSRYPQLSGLAGICRIFKGFSWCKRNNHEQSNSNCCGGKDRNSPFD